MWRVGRHFPSQKHSRSNRAANQQLFISYGNRPDDDLCLDYGFCLGMDESTNTLANDMCRIEFSLDELQARGRQTDGIAGLDWFRIILLRIGLD